MIGNQTNDDNFIFLYIIAHGNMGQVNDVNNKFEDNLREYGITKPCEFHIAQQTSYSGIVGCFLEQNPFKPDVSTRETDIITAYETYHDICPDSGLTPQDKYQTVLQELRETIGSKFARTHTSNPNVWQTYNLNANMEKRDKSFLMRDIAEMPEGNCFQNRSHYGLHIIDMKHSSTANKPEYFHAPFPNLSLSRIKPALPHASPYNIALEENMEGEYGLMNIARNLPDTPQKNLAMGIISKIYTNVIKLSDLWTLFTILGFKKVFLLDDSCRVLYNVDTPLTSAEACNLPVNSKNLFEWTPETITSESAEHTSGSAMQSIDDDYDGNYSCSLNACDVQDEDEDAQYFYKVCSFIRNTRSKSKQIEDCGLTNCCYLAQRMRLIIYAIRSLGFKLDDDVVKRITDLFFIGLKQRSKEQIFSTIHNSKASLEELINYYFDITTEKETQDLRDLQHRILLRLNYIQEVGFSKLASKVTVLTQDNVESILGASNLMPIAFILRDSTIPICKREYEVEHWGIFHTGKIMQTWGSDDVRYKWGSKPISVDILMRFIGCTANASALVSRRKLNLLSDVEKAQYEAQYKIFEDFLKSTMTPPSDLVFPKPSETIGDAVTITNNYIRRTYYHNFFNLTIEIITGLMDDGYFFNTVKSVIEDLHTSGLILQKTAPSPGGKMLPGPKHRIMLRSQSAPNLKKGGAKKTRKKRKRRTRKSIKRKRNISLKKRR
jgi:hypothetical protein